MKSNSIYLLSKPHKVKYQSYPQHILHIIVLTVRVVWLKRRGGQSHISLISTAGLTFRAPQRTEILRIVAHQTEHPKHARVPTMCVSNTTLRQYVRLRVLGGGGLLMLVIIIVNFFTIQYKLIRMTHVEKYLQILMSYTAGCHCDMWLSITSTVSSDIKNKLTHRKTLSSWLYDQVSGQLWVGRLIPVGGRSFCVAHVCSACLNSTS